MSDAAEWTRRRRADGGSPARDAVTVLAIAVSVLAIGVSLTGTHGPIRGLLALAFVLLVPGWAVLVRLDLRSTALEISLTVAVGLAIELLVSLAMLYSRYWHPLSAQAIIAIAADWSLLLHAETVLHGTGTPAATPR